MSDIVAYELDGALFCKPCVEGYGVKDEFGFKELKRKHLEQFPDYVTCSAPSCYVKLKHEEDD
jgi:hypothetical protein